MIYTEEFTLSTLICDEDDRLTIWGLARLFQDIAGDQSDMLGVGFEGLKPQHKAWVLTRVYYNVLRFPTAGEKLTLKTWAKKDNGLIAPRDYQLIDAKGDICATSSSNWVIIDTESRRVCRLYDIIKLYETEDIHATKHEKLEKMQVPDDLEKIAHINVPYSALDHTRHVNNAEYMKWFSDAIPEICRPRSCGRREIAEFDINYLKETKYGDPNVFLFGGNYDNTYYFKLTNSNGTAVTASIVLK